MSSHPDEPRDREEQHGAEPPAGEDEQPAGLTEEFEAEFGDEFGADLSDELGSEDDGRPEEDEQPAGTDGDPADVVSQETVEADVLALGDEEEAREHADQAAAALESASDGEQVASDDAAPPEGEVTAGEEARGEEADEDAEAPEAEEAREAEKAPEEEEKHEVEEPPKVGLWARFLAASLVIVISMATATSVSILLYLSDIAEGLGGIRGVQGQLEAVDGGDPQNILILGSDRRPDIEDKGRSDTTMLLRLDPDNDAIALLSLPRDLRVNIPGYGVGKLNDAYFRGGPQKTLQVVKQVTGLNIHHVVNVDFKGFEQAINAIDCVYVDVDRDYFNSNEGLTTGQLYSEIDINAGYQLLCGDRALQYVRYRHTDNDLVRAARQQDFLREARQKIGPSRLFRDRLELIEIFKKYTTSDINDSGTMLEVLKTFLGAADAPVKQIHFQGTLGESYVTASNEQIQKAVEQFLGIQDTPGSLGDEGGDGGGGGKPKEEKPKPQDDGGPALIDSAATGQTFAQQFAPVVGFPVFYPTKLVPGSQIIEESREYKIADEDDKVHRAYKLVFSIPGTEVPFEYYGLMGTTWTDPPILDNPTETRQIGGRTYDLFYDGDRLRLVAWRTNDAAYWLNNTLTQTLEEDEMLAIADSMDEVSPPKQGR
jgi:polyisoprenyl-teichoic acid--peptidoglycan teichoic acid transferase